MTATGEPAARRWVTLTGYVLYLAVLAAGYYYNLTFVQLGLIDLGTRLVGMGPRSVSTVMAVFAVSAFVIAAVTGWMMDKRGWSSRLRLKLRILFVVVAIQTVLTMVVGSVATPLQYLAWVLAGAIVIGVGMPVTFSFMIDFIPIRHRGGVATAVAGLAFAAAALYPLQWRIEEFAPVMTAVMVPGVAALGVVSFRRFGFVDELARQHERFGVGRFCRPDPVPTASFAFWGPLALMFSVFFIDSLGFLRIIDSPAYISTSWQSPDIGVRLFIAVTHIVGAAMAGVLYTALDRRWLWGAVLALFAFTHLLYTFHLGTAPAGIDPPLALPLFYVLAVYSYGALGTDRYPPFTLADTDYPARLDVAYPEHLSRGLVLVKWWLLAIPHYLIIGLFTSGLIWWTTELNDGNPVLQIGGGLIGILVLIAAVALAFTGGYPQGVFDVVMGLNRWVYRVLAYAALMRDDYPPFRLDTGGSEPGATPPTPPAGPIGGGDMAADTDLSRV